MSQLIALILAYRYLIIFPLAILEGPLLALLLGYLVHEGLLNPYITFFLLLLGDIGPDIFWWRLGRYGNKKLLESKYFSHSPHAANNLKTLEYLWHRHTGKTMFFGKLSYGINIPIIISSGVARLPIKRFVIYSLPVGVIQVGVPLVVGYYLGNSYQLALRYAQYPALILGGLALIVILVYVSILKYSANAFKKQEENIRNEEKA